MLMMASLPKSSYYDNHYRQTAALIRARQPYLIKNIITGTSLFALAIGICMIVF
jgi:cytochrome c oxidase assembly factor 3, fungi type